MLHEQAVRCWHCKQAWCLIISNCTARKAWAVHKWKGGDLNCAGTAFHCWKQLQILILCIPALDFCNDFDLGVSLTVSLVFPWYFTRHSVVFIYGPFDSDYIFSSAFSKLPQPLVNCYLRHSFSCFPTTLVLPPPAHLLLSLHPSLPVIFSNLTANALLQTLHSSTMCVFLSITSVSLSPSHKSLHPACTLPANCMGIFCLGWSQDMEYTLKLGSMQSLA